jgi:hypothetical protein
VTGRSTVFRRLLPVVAGSTLSRLSAGVEKSTLPDRFWIDPALDLRIREDRDGESTSPCYPRVGRSPVPATGLTEFGINLLT